MKDARIVANRFLELARERDETLTPMQLLKLVYIAHGWMLGLLHRPLIRDEVQAWQYGPVIPSLYRELRHFGGRPVTGEIRTEQAILDDLEKSIVGQTYDRYGRLSGPALSRLTHAPGTPWDQTYEEGRFGTTIPTDIIEDHYSRMAQQVPA